MKQLTELQLRTKTAEAQFQDAMEENRKRSERLSERLKMIEDKFACNENEMKRLREEQASAKAENEQLRDILQTLLALTEDGEVNNIGSAMREMEERVDRLSALATRVAETPDEDSHRRGNGHMFKAINRHEREDRWGDAAVN